MRPNDYDFQIGDVVITVEGLKGHIVDICYCTECQKRGFFELTWRTDDGKYDDWISIEDANGGFCAYYQIGKYRFADFDKDDVLSLISSYEKKIKALKRQLSSMEEIENEQRNH